MENYYGRLEIGTPIVLIIFICAIIYKEIIIGFIRESVNPIYISQNNRHYYYVIFMFF